LIACYLVRLDKQFFSGTVKIFFFGQRWFSGPRKELARTPMYR